ncbi:pilus assembly protein TadG-related protein [Solicola sp. PLA-1-18]|uniref:pilus assembly protein TadG-related protein n=1 Tax=Solicola sp. PLA-1-18 TaxID=3380532 RepID=UPI003B801C64
MTPMIVGFFVVVGLLAAVVVNASAAFLTRQELNNLADGAALAAADGVQGEQVYTGGLGENATIDASSARRYVAEYLADTGAPSQYPGLRWQVTPDGDAVRVRVAAPMDLPLGPPGWGDRTRVTGEAAVLLKVR